MSTNQRRGIYEHRCRLCNDRLLSHRVIVDAKDTMEIIYNDENNAHQDQNTSCFDEINDHAVYNLCETCFTRKKHALYRSLRERKPLVDQRCDLCGAGPPSRFLKDFMCNICDTCQDENDRTEEQIMSSTYTLAVQQEKFEVPDEIISGKLYLGSKNSTTNVEVLRHGMNIAQIIVCCGHLPEFFRDNENLSMSFIEKLPRGDNTANAHEKYAIRYLRLPIRDNLDQDLLPYLESALEFINEGYEKYHCATLVHCHAGVSRSASVVIAWLMRNLHMDYDAAYRFVKEKRKAICPNSNFVEQLRSFS